MSIPSKYIIFFLIIITCFCTKKPHVDLSVISPGNNLAYNNGYSLYPNPLESDKGWGGAPFKWHLVDGIRTKSNYWNMGLAFTGGILEYIDTCGWRQATVDFGKPVIFNRIVIWLYTNDVTMLPDSFKIQHWTAETRKWELTKQVRDKRKQMEPYFNEIQNECIKKKVALAVPYEEVFPSLKSSKVRFSFNNCGIDFGWINEFEVYNDSVSVQNRNLVVR
jgi:hypothetical protein